MEQIKAMYEEMEKDADFGEEIARLFEKGTVADVLSAASKKGFNITEAEWEEYRNKAEEERRQKLSEEELADVAGGILEHILKKGNRVNPHKSSSCYKNLSPAKEFRNGVERQKCVSPSCAKQINYGQHQGDWFECRCWGTNHCVGMWHNAHGCA